MTKDKKPYKFLVIEDNPGDFVIVEEFLCEQILNPGIVHALNYKQAAEILAQAQDFSVILLDLSLPDNNGEKLINEVLQLAPAHCPIIVLTGYTDAEFGIKSIALGVMDYLLKDELTATSLYKSIIYSIERKHHISEIRASEKRYSDLFNLSPQPMWVFDTETFQFIQVNNAALALYGYTEEEFLKMTLMDIKHAEDISDATGKLGKPYPGEGFIKSAVMHHKKTGEIMDVEVYSTPIILNDKSYRSTIVIDITEKKLFEQKLIRAIIKTQEDERYEIGGELHDNVCQILAASQLNLGMLKEHLTAANMQWYDKCRQNIILAAEEIRNLSHRLAPAIFDDSNLEEAFGILLHSFNIGDRYKILLNVDDNVKKAIIPMDLQLNLYRILQEQLKNIMKYSKAEMIEVDVIIFNNKIKMRISDDGIGFNSNAVKTGIGIANMRRRTELFSGAFNLDSSPGNGCVIITDIPLPENCHAIPIKN
ncbi:MAG: PAS domain S-box protein [Ferruginibacter sp.]